MFYLFFVIYCFDVCLFFTFAAFVEVKACNENPCKHLWVQRILTACVKKIVIYRFSVVYVTCMIMHD